MILSLIVHVGELTGLLADNNTIKAKRSVLSDSFRQRALLACSGIKWTHNTETWRHKRQKQ